MRYDVVAGMLLFLGAMGPNAAWSQINAAAEAAAIGIARPVEIKIGEGYVTETESIEATITVLEVLRGNPAWELVRVDSSNKLPSAGMEYLAVRIRFEYGSKGENDRSYAIRDEQFALYSETGKQYDRPSIAHPKPELNGRIYPGDLREGWLCFLVSMEDKKPLMSFGNNYSRVWFKLYR